MTKLGGRCIVQKFRPSSNLGVIALPGVRTPKNVLLGYDVGKISAGCLVMGFILLCLCDSSYRVMFNLEPCILVVLFIFIVLLALD